MDGGVEILDLNLIGSFEEVQTQENLSIAHLEPLQGEILLDSNLEDLSSLKHEDIAVVDDIENDLNELEQQVDRIMVRPLNRDGRKGKEKIRQIRKVTITRLLKKMVPNCHSKTTDIQLLIAISRYIRFLKTAVNSNDEMNLEFAQKTYH